MSTLTCRKVISLSYKPAAVLGEPFHLVRIHPHRCVVYTWPQKNNSLEVLSSSQPLPWSYRIQGKVCLPVFHLYHGVSCLPWVTDRQKPMVRRPCSRARMHSHEYHHRYSYIQNLRPVYPPTTFTPTWYTTRSYRDTIHLPFANCPRARHRRRRAYASSNNPS
jgi:hypothetical protein